MICTDNCPDVKWHRDQRIGYLWRNFQSDFWLYFKGFSLSQHSLTSLVSYAKLRWQMWLSENWSCRDGTRRRSAVAVACPEAHCSGATAASASRDVTRFSALRHPNLHHGTRLKNIIIVVAVPHLVLSPPPTPPLSVLSDLYVLCGRRILLISLHVIYIPEFAITECLSLNLLLFPHSLFCILIRD